MSDDFDFDLVDPAPPEPIDIDDFDIVEEPKIKGVEAHFIYVDEIEPPDPIEEARVEGYAAAWDAYDFRANPYQLNSKYPNKAKASAWHKGWTTGHAEAFPNEPL